MISMFLQGHKLYALYICWIVKFVSLLDSKIDLMYFTFRISLARAFFNLHKVSKPQ